MSKLLALRLPDFQLDAGIVAIRTLKRLCYSVREMQIPPALMTEIADHLRGASLFTFGRSATPLHLFWNAVSFRRRFFPRLGRRHFPKGRAIAYPAVDLRSFTLVLVMPR